MPTATMSGDYQPIRYIGRVPIYATTVITAIFGIGVIVFTVLASSRISPGLLLGFRTTSFADGAFWQPLTYTTVNGPSFFTLLGLFAFYSWALESERFLGRGRFIKLFALLVLLLPAVLGILHLTRISAGTLISGNYEMTAAFLVAFATIYPNIEYFGWIPLKWFAFACCAIGSLMYFPDHNWIGLVLFWSELAAAFGFVCYFQRGGELGVGEFASKLNPFKRQPKFRVLPTPPQATRSAAHEAVESIDPLLDKIARSGIDSLTSAEKARLEKARQALIKKQGQ